MWAAGQEAGINNMTVDEYIGGRAAFDCRKVVRDPCVARKERTAYEAKLKNVLRQQYRKEGLGAKEADQKAAKMAAEKMRTLAALHNPDMVAGGKDVIGGFGDGNINKRIGAQWNRGQRLAELDRAANAVPSSLRSTPMNVRLERCK